MVEQEQSSSKGSLGESAVGLFSILALLKCYNISCEIYIYTEDSSLEAELLSWRGMCTFIL